MNTRCKRLLGLAILLALSAVIAPAAIAQQILLESPVRPAAAHPDSTETRLGIDKKRPPTRF